MKEINYKEMKFNPFNLIGDEWMLVTLPLILLAQIALIYLISTHV